MTYEQALQYIHGTKRFGSKPGLERIRQLLNYFNNPQKELRTIHVAGTNGKGSVCAMTANILQAAGYKTGLNISPFVEDFRERIQINREMISKKALAELTEEVSLAIESIVSGGGIHPTEFEIVTAIALIYFARERCDYCVLEVGLGGRFDATNIIEAPLAAAITSISFDHMAYLGNTLESIAREKCGILKKGSIAVSSMGQKREVMEVISSECMSREIPLHIPNPSDLKVLSSSLSGTDIIYKGIDYHIALLGEHQIQNALTAIELVNALRKRGTSIPGQAVKNAIATAQWNGRLEIISENPLCITDAAHNADSVTVLAKAVDMLLKNKRLITVMGMSADKDYAECIPLLAKRSYAFIATQGDINRALESTKIYEIALKHCVKSYCFTDIKQGIEYAYSLLERDNVLLVCGSLYIIGDAKEYLLRLLDK